MGGDTVIRLASSTCQSQVVTWEEVAQQPKSIQAQIIFASSKSFVNTAPQLQKSLENKLGIPPSFFDRLYLQSNGFAGHDVRLGPSDEVEAYLHWSRFTVKQTFDTLKPKRNFTPHVSHRHLELHGNNNAVPVHGPQSVQHGWEWYEMGFIISWKSSESLTLLCFDLPTHSQSSIQTMIGSWTVVPATPHSMFLLVSDELLRLYDDSVWSVRNHISQWEAKRSIVTDYFLLHEIARHGVHVNETLSVAMRSLDAVRRHHKELRSRIDSTLRKGGCNGWDGVGSRLAFQYQFLENLLQRSSANNARIQNEITLAFNEAAQRDSKIQVRIGEEARREASAMKAIAVVTMTFLPATFVSTIFGTNFFSFESREGADGVAFVTSGHFWIYWVISVPLTVATLALWFWWSRWTRRSSLSAARPTPLLTV